MTPDGESLPWRSRAALVVGLGLLHVVGRTWRYRVKNGAALAAARATRRGFVFSLWHGHLLPLLWHHRGQGVLVLISEHKDGELVARAATSLGFGLIRGSTTRGAGRALISLVRSLEAGKEVAVTPDGPRGPARKYAPGALVAAQRSKTDILPVAIAVSSAWRLKSWDGFMIPKPFARVTVAYGEPTGVRAADPRGAADEAPRFEALMEKTVDSARSDA
ncbi:MAG TPA: lysophospholipid acyltransferase family protein [Gemmatimonadaceae bacterium]|nr:lysophospholipid acyltransferase family protein [Gemmatimonadaceae bacterium]